MYMSLSYIFRNSTVPWCCWLGDRRGIWPEKNLHFKTPWDGG